MRIGQAPFGTSPPGVARSCSKGWQGQTHRREQKLCRSCAVGSLFGKAFEGGLDGLRRAAFQEVSRRGPEEEHVSHAGGPGEHHIQVEPPLCIVQAQVPRRLQALTLADFKNNVTNWIISAPRESCICLG